MKLTTDLFEPHVGSDVIVHLDDGTRFTLKLTRVSTSSAQRSQDQDDDAPAQSSFEMTLQGPHSPVIAAMTYPVSFPDSEPVYLFLSPHYQDADKTLYNIVVN